MHGGATECDRHPVCVRENKQILSTEMEFSKNLYANVCKSADS